MNACRQRKFPFWGQRTEIDTLTRLSSPSFLSFISCTERFFYRDVRFCSSKSVPWHLRLKAADTISTAGVERVVSGAQLQCWRVIYESGRKTLVDESFDCGCFELPYPPGRWHPDWSWAIWAEVTHLPVLDGQGAGSATGEVLSTFCLRPLTFSPWPTPRCSCGWSSS